MNFSQFAAKDNRQLSDIEAVQAGVEDASSATAFSAIAQGISGLGEGLMSAEVAMQKAEEKTTKRMKKEQDTTFSNRYDYAIEKYSQAVRDGEMSKEQERCVAVDPYG